MFLFGFSSKHKDLTRDMVFCQEAVYMSGERDNVMFSFFFFLILYSFTDEYLHFYAYLQLPALKRVKSYHPFQFGIITPDPKSYIQFLSTDKSSRCSFNFWNVSNLCLSQINMCVAFYSVQFVCEMRKYMFLVNSCYHSKQFSSFSHPHLGQIMATIFHIFSLFDCISI